MALVSVNVINKVMQKYVIMIDDEYEYDLFVDKVKDTTTYVLFYSQSQAWSSNTRGTQAMKMIDDGNGVKFTKNLKVMDYIDYAQARILMNFAQASSTNRAELESVTNVYSVALNSVSSKPIEI
jgi:hypothetical protein